MSLLIFNLLLSMIFIGINPTITLAQNMTNNETGNTNTNSNTDVGGLSTESIEIAEGNKTDLIRNATSGNISFGGLSTESIEIAEGNKTDLIRNTNNSNATNFGGLSARSVNITK